MLAFCSFSHFGPLLGLRCIKPRPETLAIGRQAPHLMPMNTLCLQHAQLRIETHE
jgi:hypothetical protein